MQTEYSTSNIAPKERFDYWRDVICDAHLPMECSVERLATLKDKSCLNGFHH